jgi:hypothetical protein
MIDPTPMLVKQMNYTRMVGIGLNAVLLLLTSDTDRGYAQLLEVDGGWTLEDGTIGQGQVLHIIEHGDCSREVLLQTKLFSINNVVYEITGEINFEAAPAGSRIKEWKFAVNPTSEVYP